MSTALLMTAVSLCLGGLRLGPPRPAEVQVSGGTEDCQLVGRGVA